MAHGTPLISVSTGRPLVTRTAGPFAVTLMEHAGEVRLARHRHEEAIVGLLLRGRYDERIGTRTVEPAPASLLIKPPETPHANTIGREGTDTILIQIRPAQIPAELAPLLDRPAIRHDSRFHAIGQELLAELRMGVAADTVGVAALVTELLAVAARRDGGTGHSRRQAWIPRVRELLREGPESLSLAELASLAGVDRAHLARAFRRAFGCTVGEYRRAVRMEKAARLLRESDATVGRIAAELGFFDQAHFTRAFRAVYGTTPGTSRGHPSSRS